MLEAYSENITVDSNTAIPFYSVSVNKGASAVLSSPTTIEFNNKGAYAVTINSSLATATSVQLFKNGVAQPQAQSTGTNPGFTTLVQVGQNNCGCCCTSPTVVQIKNTGSASSDFTICKVTIVKLPCDKN